jgi:hypothetical protein
MKFEKDDYVIAVPDGAKAKKPFFFRISSINKGVATGTLEKDSHIPQRRQTVEVPVANIIAVLPEEPYRGRSYGCDTSLVYRGRKTHDKFGALHFFYKPAPEVGERIVKAFDKSYKILKAQRLEFLVNPETTVWEITPPNGEKYTGMFKSSRDVEKNPHRGIIRPELEDPVNWPYTILHELSHHLHRAYLTGSKLEGAWVKLYNKSILVQSIKKEDSQRILDDMLAQETLPSDFKGQLDEDDALIFKAIIKAIRTQHKISLKELDLLFEADFRDDIRTVWPTRGLSNTNFEPLVSEYGLTKVSELMAEAISYHLCGKVLPKEVVALVEKTLSYARANHE